MIPTVCPVCLVDLRHGHHALCPRLKIDLDEFGNQYVTKPGTPAPWLSDHERREQIDLERLRGRHIANLVIRRRQKRTAILAALLSIASFGFLVSYFFNELFK